MPRRDIGACIASAIAWMALAPVAYGHAPDIGLSTKYLNFSAAPRGPNPPIQAVALTNTTHGPMPWTVAVATRSGGNWLAVSPTSGFLPGLNPNLEWVYLLVTVTSSPLAAGTYYGTITISAPGNATSPPADNTPQTIEVALTVSGTGATAPGIGITPNALSLDALAGAASTASIPVQISNTGGGTLSWSAVAATSSGGNWLLLSPSSGVNTGTMTVWAIPSTLKPGTYTGQITIGSADAANSPQQIAVTLQVRATATATLDVSTAALNFSAQVDGGNPPPQSLEIRNAGGGALSWRADASTFNGGSWLSVTPSGGAAPGTALISVVAAGLPRGNYAGTVNVSADGVTNSPLHIAVTLTVRGLQPVVEERGVVNAATFLTGFLAPGELVSIFGSNLGPRNPVNFILDPATQKIPIALGGTRVTFDGVPAPLFFVSQTQVNLQAPFELTGKLSTRMTVSVEGLDPVDLVLPVRETSPGVLTLDGTRAAALNQDFSVNAPDNAAARGSVIQLFLTGQGLFNPPVETGALGPAAPPLATIAAPVSVTVDGLLARVLFAGAAPGLAGVAQLNVEVPQDLSPSSQAVVWVLVDPYPAGKRVTVAVR